MGKKDPRVDAYVAKSADFAKPILKHLRSLVHKACPDAEETMKWSFPHFEYRGMLCSMASFKQHCAFGFWKSRLIVGLDKATSSKTEEAMGQFGRISDLSQLPADKTMISLIKKAAKLNEDGVKAPTRIRRTSPKPLIVPDYFMAALRANKRALKTFEDFSLSHRREYVEWITEAKTEATRQRRLAQAIELLAEGKSRHWKYISK
jgi:uncharacterized protein YdeI (YjbR/CyaY-like superfamily)